MTMPDTTEAWPIVIHTNLKNEAISLYFQSHGHKVRFSESILPSTVIFPKSSIAFLITQGSDLMEIFEADSSHSSVEDSVLTRVEKFTSTHRNCYLMIKASNLEEVWCAVEKVQMRFINTNLQMVFVDKDMDCIQSMITIAQATCKPASTVLKSKLKQHLIGQLSIERILSILEPIGLSEHEIFEFVLVMKDPASMLHSARLHCLVLQQGLGSLRNISQATEDQLLDCSLSPEAVQKLMRFLEKDSQ